jgi:hypothetical protein
MGSVIYTLVTDPPIFGFLTARYANSMDMFSSSSWSYSSFDLSDDELYKYTYEMTSLPLASRKKLAKNDGGRRSANGDVDV